MHYLGKEFCSKRALVLFYFMPVKRQLRLDGKAHQPPPGAGMLRDHSRSHPSAKGKALLSPAWAHVTICHLDTWVMGDARSRQTGETNMTKKSCKSRCGLFWNELLRLLVLKTSVDVSGKTVL